jgi:hypothetical protein
LGEWKIPSGSWQKIPISAYRRGDFCVVSPEGQVYRRIREQPKRIPVRKPAPPRAAPPKPSEEAMRASRAAATAIQAAMSLPSGYEALLQEQPVLEIVRRCVSAAVSQNAERICRRDRQASMSAMRAIFRDRKLRDAVGTEKVDERAYEAVLSDLSAVLEQSPFPALQVDVVPAQG